MSISYLFLSLSLSLFIHIYEYVYVCRHIYLHIYVDIYICIYICVYICKTKSHFLSGAGHPLENTCLCPNQAGGGMAEPGLTRSVTALNRLRPFEASDSCFCLDT